MSELIENKIEKLPTDGATKVEVIKKKHLDNNGKDSLAVINDDIMKAQKEISHFLSNTKCGICLGMLIEPVVLPCSHMTCVECLRDNVKTADRSLCTKCPTCRYPFHSMGYDESREDICEKLRPQSNISTMLNLLGGVEYQQAVKARGLVKIRKGLLDSYCQSERASVIQGQIRDIMRDKDAIHIPSLTQCFAIPPEELYYGIMVYVGFWDKINKAGFNRLTERFLFFKDWIIDTSGLGQFSPLLVIDTKIPNLSLEDRYYLSLIAAAKSHWAYHCQDRDCNGYKVIQSHITNFSKKIVVDGDDSSSSEGARVWEPEWLTAYRIEEHPAWMEAFFGWLEDLSSGERRLVEIMKAHKAWKKSFKALEKENSKLVKEAKQAWVEAGNKKDEFDPSTVAREELPVEPENPSGVDCFSIGEGLIKGVYNAPEATTARSSSLLACKHCHNYPCQCDHCDNCENVVMECQCDESVYDSHEESDEEESY